MFDSTFETKDRNLNFARICNTAADILDTSGHCKHQLETLTGQHCLMGAILVAQNVSVVNCYTNCKERETARDIAVELAKDALGKVLPRRTCSYGNDYSAWDRMVRWNNSKERKGPEVSAALRVTANRLIISDKQGGHSSVPETRATELRLVEEPV